MIYFFLGRYSVVLEVKGEFKKFASSPRKVLNYIKHSKDENELARLLAEDECLKAMEAEEVRVVEIISHRDFAIDEKTEVVNVCQAVEDMMKTRERKGEEVGQKRGEEIGRKQENISSRTIL